MRKNGIIYLIGIICFIYLTNCGPKFTYYPEPEKDVKEWIRNFFRQKSFSYEYYLRSAGARISARGDCVLKRGEYIKGFWDYGDTVVYFEYIGIKDREWAKKDGKWLESVRGEESNIYEQIKRILAFEKFGLLNKDKNYLFSFDAKLPFLAPDRWRDMVGYIEISHKYYLPEEIWVGLPDSTVYWKVRITNYNHNREISPPFIETKLYEIRPDTTVSPDVAIKKIKGRLRLLKLNWKLTKENGKIILKAPEDYSIYDIQDMLAPGITYIYEVARERSTANRISYLKANVNQTVYLSGQPYGHDIIKSTALKFDHLLRPFITIRLKNTIQTAGQIAVEVDSFIIGITALDTGKKMDKIVLLLDMEYPEILKYNALIYQPLFKMEILPLNRESY